MFTSVIRYLQVSFRAFVLAAGLAVFACTAMLGTSLAETAPTSPGDVTGTSLYSDKFCGHIRTLFNSEVAWIYEHTGEIANDDPEMQQHVNQMWYYWSILEYKCGIDIHH